MPTPQTSTKSSKFRFYTTREYFDELIVGIRDSKPGDRVLLMTMTFNPIEPTIAVLCKELIRAASRGVHVTLSVDAHSFMVGPVGTPGPLMSRRNLPKRLPARFEHKLSILEAINAYPGSRANIINTPLKNLSLPIAGRSHIKIGIINNRVFVGGCNLQAESWTDMMISWESAISADRLHKTMRGITERKHAGQALAWVDRAISIEPDTNIFIDSGLHGQSLIFDEALKLIDASTTWLVITCQYFPNSVTARHLADAIARGVKVEVVYAHPKHQGFIGGLGQQISILRERTRLPKILFEHALSRKDPMLHAKLIASDAGMMLGSHNYVKAGVILGTAEIALKSSSEELARSAVKTLHRGLKKPI